MTPAQSTALALPDYEHDESRVPGSANSTAPAHLHPYARRAEDDELDLRTAIAILTRTLAGDIAPRSLFAAPLHQDITAANLLIAQPRDEDVTMSAFTAEPSKLEGAEPAIPLPIIPAKQPGFPAPNVSVPKVDGRRLADASSVADVLGVLRDHGHIALAKEIAELIGRLADEPDEPPPNTDSLKLLARVAFGEDSLRAPRSLALTKDGYLHAEWYLGEAKLFMTFLPTAHIRVVAVHPGTGGDDDLRVAGSLYSPNTESLAKWLASSLLK